MLSASHREHKPNDYIRIQPANVPRRQDILYGQTSTYASYRGSAMSAGATHVAENPTKENGVRGSSQRKTVCAIERQHQGVDRPVTIVTAAHCRRPQAMDKRHSRGICWTTPMTSWPRAAGKAVG